MSVAFAQPTVINPTEGRLNGTTVQKNQLVGKDVYFAPGGGIRTRSFNVFNGTGGAFANNETIGYLRSRAQLDIKLHKGEFFESFVRFIHAAQWGSQSAPGNNENPAVRDSFDSNNGALVSQAWGLWKVTDTLGFKFGRSPLHLGRGLMYGENDWFDVPYTFDHFDILFDWTSVELSIIGAKIRELQTVVGQTVSPDPEENHYIIDVKLTDNPDWIKSLNFHFAQINRDNGSADGGTTVLPSLNVQRLGIDFVFQTKSLTGETFLGVVNGEERAAQVGSVGQSIVDFKLNYKQPAWSNMNIYGLLHRDSGDDNLADTDNKHFDSFFYDVYGRAGRMEFIRWGNLTSLAFGFEIEATADFSIGFEYWSFRKTEAADNPELGQAGSLLAEQISAGNLTLAPVSDLGTEFDLILSNKWSSGVEASFVLSSFKPGETFTGATAPAGGAVRSSIIQFYSELKFFF